MANIYGYIAIFLCFTCSNYMFKVNNRNSRTRCEICSMSMIKKPELRKWLDKINLTPVKEVRELQVQV